MSGVFDSQFQAMRDAFAREGTGIEVAYTPSGEVDYIYQEGRLLTRSSVADVVLTVLAGTVIVAGDERRPLEESGLVLLDIDNVVPFLSVPQALDVIDAELRRLGLPNPAPDGFPLLSPVHVTYVAPVRICPATEPEAPCRRAPDELCPPCPPPAADGGAGVVIGVCDTGLLADIASAPWLGGVTGAVDPLGPQVAGGLYDIPKYCGHGTFVAGVARCEAPEAVVYVANEFSYGGGLLEWQVVQTLQGLLASTPAPQVVNLSAGSYTRNNWLPLSFLGFDGGGVTLVCAAGNDARRREFWPAAFDWAVAVGALGADQQNRAWFSNYGDWVDVYALGEGLVNAFATGSYTYQEPPKRPAVQVFDGRARWSGTSFAAPLVAGLIAAAMSEAGLTATDATQAVLAQAQAQALPGVGPALYPR